MDERTVINAIIAGYFEPYEIAIATRTNMTSNMVELCAQNGWIYGMQAIINAYPINTWAILAAIRHKHLDMTELLLAQVTLVVDELPIIYMLAVHDSPLLFTCCFWKIDRNVISQAIDGAASANNTALMQKIYNIAQDNKIIFEPCTFEVIRAGHMEALQLLLIWGVDILQAIAQTVQYDQPACMQLIHDFDSTDIDYAYLVRYAILKNSYAVLIRLRRLHNMYLPHAFAYAVVHNRCNIMRMIHNWGCSFDVKIDVQPATRELLSYFGLRPHP